MESNFFNNCLKIGRLTDERTKIEKQIYELQKRQEIIQKQIDKSLYDIMIGYQVKDDNGIYYFLPNGEKNILPYVRNKNKKLMLSIDHSK